jgi:hypothetical protein
MKKFEIIPLGKQVEDIVTGFSGIAVSRLEYINGCVQYGLRRRVDEKGARPDIEYVDVQQLKIIGDGVEIEGTGDGSDSHPDAPRS